MPTDRIQSPYSTIVVTALNSICLIIHLAEVNTGVWKDYDGIAPDIYEHQQVDASQSTGKGSALMLGIRLLPALVKRLILWFSKAVLPPIKHLQSLTNAIDVF